MRKSFLFDFNKSVGRERQGEWTRILVALIIVQGFFSACLSIAGEAKRGWEVEWEKTVTAARQEGQVTIYGTTPIHSIVEAGVFQKAYPGIKVVAVAPAPGEAFQRLMAERRAGKYLADLYTAGVTSPLLLHRVQALDPVKPLLVLPEVVDESKWLGGQHRYNDPEQRYIFVWVGHPLTGGISFNTNLVNLKEISSFWDLVQPKWKGKIEVRDIRIPGSGSINMMFFYHNPELGPKFVRHLFGEMDIMLFRNISQAVDWLATGKFAICFFCGDSETERARRQGLRVTNLEYILKEGAVISSQGGDLTLVNKAPHPNAAKVFVNWLLSREGQLTSQRTGSNWNSRRVDIPKDMLPPQGRLIEGAKYLDVETPERNNVEPVIKVFEEALAEAEKRKKG